MRNSLLSRIVSYGVGGFAATVPMTAVMFAVQQLLPTYQRSRQEPLVITDAILHRLGLHDRLNERHRQLAGLASHFGFGTVAGSAVGMLRGRASRMTPAREVTSCVPAPLRTAVGGIVAGSVVWATSYAGWLPLLGILPPPHRRTRGRTVLLLAGHFVWGTTLVSVGERLVHRRQSRSADV